MGHRRQQLRHQLPRLLLGEAAARHDAIEELAALNLLGDDEQVVLVFERTEDSVQRVQSAGSRVRLDDDNNDEDWDLGGTSVGGVSTPIRPKPDKF